VRDSIPATGGACRAFLLAAFLGFTACATSNATARTNSLEGRGAVIEVRNDEFDDMVVYLFRGATRIPLGVVPGLSRRTLNVDAPRLGGGSSVVLGAGMRGAPIKRVTAPFDLAPGRIATWVLRARGEAEEPVVR
jgi:hypothetical protein